MRAAIYARFSTEKQSEASIEDQFRVCERIAERESFDIVARFSDAALSGGTSSRPGYQALLRAARRREFDVIVAEDSSRLWRELAEQWRALKELQDLGVHVVGHGLDTRREESKILLAVSGAMAEAYRDEIACRTRRGLEGRAVAGKTTGGKAYGYTAARDSSTGLIEINETEAAIIRRIFGMYADGMSPRAIAAQLNAEGIPSAGASWKRSQRRTDGKWLASAIHGDINRGTGILNNRRYVGVVVWGRSQWKRGAADSSKRRNTMLAKATTETADERLRIVSDELWRRVKARQLRGRQGPGALVRGALRKRAVGAGRPPRYLLSGLLRCGVCGASFTVSNGERYQCASHINGNACDNSLSVLRVLVESRIRESVKADLRDPAIIAEAERRAHLALNARPKAKANSAPRIAELQREIGNLTDAIAAGLLKSSPALGKRLNAAESEFARLEADRIAPPARVGRIAPRIAEHFLALVERLEQPLGRDPERSRIALTQAIGPKITLLPDVSRKYLWAEYGLETVPLMAVAAGSELMVAGAGFGICLLRVPRPALPHNSAAATALAAWRGRKSPA
jgi:site-specific DNA recombinase